MTNRPILTRALALVLFATALSGCFSAAQFRLPMPVTQARMTFLPLAACASREALQSVEHPDSLNVRYDANTWIQYMIQGEAYNMVILVDNDVPEAQRPARASDAKAKGDALFACALANPAPAGYAAPAPAPVYVPAAPVAAPPPGVACSQDYQCPTKNCTNGMCQSNDPGAPCGQDYHCSSKNCTSGVCQTNDRGAACSQDYHCASRNCTNGMCQ